MPVSFIGALLDSIDAPQEYISTRWYRAPEPLASIGVRLIQASVLGVQISDGMCASMQGMPRLSESSCVALVKRLLHCWSESLTYVPCSCNSNMTQLQVPVEHRLRSSCVVRCLLTDGYYGFKMDLFAAGFASLKAQACT